MRLFTLKRSALVAVLVILCISLGRCQDDEEDDEEYEEDTVDDTTTRKYRRRTTSTSTASTTVAPVVSGRNDTDGEGGSTEKAVTSAAGTNSSASSSSGTSAAAAPVVTSPAPSPTQPTPATRATTLSDSEEEIETTTEEPEEGLAYVFRPLNNLIDNIVAGNVTGIVDQALSIRTPPEIRSFVNHVMHNVFGVGIGGALKQFTPSLFSSPSTQAPVVNGRDPIPTQEPPPPTPATTPITIPLQAIIDARSNATEETKQSKTQQYPLQLKFTHPGAPASRLKCEVVTD